jgi:hypothetical protein
MTDRAQFEAMLNALINEDQDAAKEIFHNIVVAKSREIYEELLAEDFEEPEVEEAFPAAEEEGEEEEGSEDEEGAEEEGDEEGEENPFGDEEGEEEGEGSMDDAEQSDRILDLEDALEELKAEFEQLMAGEEGEENMDDMGGMDDMGDMDAEPAMKMGMGEEDELAGLMEYVNQVGGKTYNTFGKMGDNGNNVKSTLDGSITNDMGGSSGNIAQNFSTTKGGTEGGLASPKAGDLTSGLGTIHNRKDSKAGKTAFTKKEPGHGAEKAGAKETADNKGSFLKQAKK